MIFGSWEDQTAESPYPFADTATFEHGDIVVERDFFQDANIVVYGDPVVAPCLVRIASAQNAKLVFTVLSNGVETTGTWDSTAPGPVALSDSFHRPAGTLLVEPEKAGVWAALTDFVVDIAEDAMPFVASAISIMPNVGVYGFKTPDGEIFSGDVWLVGERGVVLTQVTPGTIKIDFAGDPAVRERICGTSRVSTNFVKTINGQPGNNFGDFIIASIPDRAADTAFRIKKSGNGLQLIVAGARGD